MGSDRLRMGNGHPPAVLIGLGPQGLSMARSLGPRGIKIYGVDKRKHELGRYSRWIHNDAQISYFGPNEDLLRGLIGFGRKMDMKPVVFISSDEYLEFVARWWNDLHPYYILTESMRAERCFPLLDKRLFYERCKQLDIPLPATYFPVSEEDADYAGKHIRYPAIIKPTVRLEIRKYRGAKKLVEVQNETELLHWWRRFKGWGADAVIQECILGPERNIAVAAVYMDRDQECKSIFTARKSRQYPPFYGSGSYVEACWLPEIAEMSIQMLKHFAYHGLCGTEYKWDDRDGVWKVIEVNARPVLWYGLAPAAGVDVFWDAYCDLTGYPNPVSYGKQNDKMRWQFLTRDVPAALYFYVKGGLSTKDLFRTAIDPRHKKEAVLDLGDWKANLGYFISTIGEVWRYLTKRMG